MNIRRHIYRFQPRFVPEILNGRKSQTIRPMRKRLPAVGDIADLRCWEGQPYRSKNIRLADARIIDLAVINISDQSVTLNYGNKARQIAGKPQLNEFAHADGFADWQDLITWFEQQHGLPFLGGLFTQWNYEGRDHRELKKRQSCQVNNFSGINNEGKEAKMSVKSYLEWKKTRMGRVAEAACWANPELRKAFHDAFDYGKKAGGSIDEMADMVHDLAWEQGWHDEEEFDEDAFIERACNNLHDEVSELHEAWRNNRLREPCDKVEKMREAGIEPLTCLEEELADILIRVLDNARRLGVDIAWAVGRKHAYNRTREKRHGGKRS